MSSETPFRVPAVPKQLKRISPSRQFMQSHAMLNTEASVATGRATVQLLGTVAAFGATSYLTLPSIMAHIGPHADAGTCICKLFPLALVLLTVLALSIWIIVSAISIAKPAREKFHRADVFMSLVKRFNISIIEINSTIHRYEKLTYREKIEINTVAQNYLNGRENILKLMETAHE